MRTCFKLVLTASLAAMAGCSTSRIYQLTPNFIDIEANRSDVWVGCSDTDPKEPNALMSFYVVTNREYHSFFYRSMRTIEECLREENEYYALMRGAPSVRIVGVSPTPARGAISDRVPSKFVQLSKGTSWQFVRLLTVNGCKPYFTKDCLPENYWAGTYPADDPYWKKQN